MGSQNYNSFRCFRVRISNTFENIFFPFRLLFSSIITNFLLIVIFRDALSKHADLPFLGHRVSVGGKAGPYEWETYGQIAKRRFSFSNPQLHFVMFCSIINQRRLRICHKREIWSQIWRTSRNLLHQSCRMDHNRFNLPKGWQFTKPNAFPFSSHSLPKQYGWPSISLYDTLGANAVAYIVDHAKIRVVVCALKQLDIVRAFLDTASITKTFYYAVKKGAPSCERI